MNEPVSGEGRYYNHSPLVDITIANREGFHIGSYRVDLEKMLQWIESEKGKRE